jgi:hypothetical protein
MDTSPDAGELFGIFRTKKEADKAVADIQKWAADMKASNAYWGVTKSDWDVVRVNVSGSGAPSGAGKGPAAAPARPLGWLSERYEVGKGGVGTISTGKGDRGGVSYGLYQLSSRVGTAQAFVNRFYPNDFRGLAPGTAAFNAVWSRLARDNPRAFGQRQHDFIQQTHYDPAARRLQRDIGLNVGTRSAALQNALWSTSVQNGPGGAARLIERAVRNVAQGQAAASLSDEAIIRAIYAERGRRDAQGLVHFRGSSQAMQDGVARRFQRELQDALNALRQEQPPAPAPAPLPGPALP